MERADGDSRPEEDAGIVAPNVATDRERARPTSRPLRPSIPAPTPRPAHAPWSRSGRPTGRLLPFARRPGHRVGGAIVLDPVLQSIETAASYESARAATMYLAIYILQNTPSGMLRRLRRGRQLDAAASTTSPSIPMELGALCVTDEDANLAVCYAERRHPGLRHGELLRPRHDGRGQPLRARPVASGGLHALHLSADGDQELPARRRHRASTATRAAPAIFTTPSPSPRGCAAVQAATASGATSTPNGEYAVQPAVRAGHQLRRRRAPPSTAAACGR